MDVRGDLDKDFTFHCWIAADEGHEVTQDGV